MTREEAKEFAPILQAYAEGKVIECRTVPRAVKSKDTPNNWTEMKDVEYWNNIEYRVKPEPKYRPFKNYEECWNEMLKHQPFGWMKGKTSNAKDYVTRVAINGVVINGNLLAFETVFHYFKFADDTLFGIKEEE